MTTEKFLLSISVLTVIPNPTLSSLQNTADRRKILEQGKYFYCTCARCEDPTELGSHMSTIICNHCSKGYMIRSKVDATKWHCLDCNYQETNVNVNNMLLKLQTEAMPQAQNLIEMEKLLLQLEHFLHPHHSLIVDLKQNIAAGLRDIINDISQCPGGKVYERKIDLCRDILKVLNTIAPGISRLKAIVIYELSTAWAEYNRMRYQIKELNKLDLRVCARLQTEYFIGLQPKRFQNNFLFFLGIFTRI